MKALRIISTIMLFVLLGTLLVHSLDSINQDLGRHLKTGQIIWETKSIPKINLFSFTEPNTSFINHHWLSEVVFYLLYGIIGLKGLIVFKVALILAAFFLIFKSLPEQARGWPFLISGLFGIFVFSSRTDVRPEIFSYLFLAFFIFAILQARQQQNHKWLYALPIVGLFWANMHIYFVLGPALLLIFLIDRLFSGENKRYLKQLFIIFVATTAVTLINPNFIHGALEPLTILKNYGYSIAENQSIFFLQNYGVMLQDVNFFEISLIVLIVSFVITIEKSLPAQVGRKKIVFEFLTALFFAILAAKMIRNFGIYAIVFVPIVALNLSSPQTKPSALARKTAYAFYCFFISLTVVLSILVINNQYHIFMHRALRFGLSIPADAEKGVEFVQQNHIQGPVFNDFDIGSFLIWKLYPQQKVFVDGRPEAYSVDFFQNIYKPMQENPALWEKYSDLYKINYVFFDTNDATPWARTFLNDISQNHDWPLVYLDNDTAIFLRRTPENQELIKKFRVK